MKQKLLIGLASVLMLAGCAKTEYGPMLVEDGEVYDTCYMPAGHGDGSGIGFTSDGNSTFTSVSVDIPARYAIVFKCQHGKFVIDGERGEELYHRLTKGDKVKIGYSEKFEVSGYKTNFAGLHFVEAIKVN